MLARLSLARSLSENALCGLNYQGEGTYTTEGIVAISEMLKVNTTLQSIRCARTCSVSLTGVSSHCQCLHSADSLTVCYGSFAASAATISTRRPPSTSAKA